MGIFSSKEEEQKEKPTTRALINPVDEQARLVRERQLYWQAILAQAQRDALLSGYERQMNNQIIKRPDRILIRINIQLINDLRAVFNLPNIWPFPAKNIWSEELQPGSMEFMKTHQYFYQRIKDNFQIRSIQKLKNPFLELHYLIAKQKCMEVYGENIKEVLLFHGTKAESLQGIFTYNFDRTKVRHHKFGHGISFAKDALYATHYHHDNKTNYAKVMIIAKVFFGTLHCDNSDTTVVPPIPSYTSCNTNMSVFVKFDDASYYPEYVIHYTGFHHQ